MGPLVFGGGHVVLPLLRQEVVRPGWLDDDRFLAGYGAAQAVPGPLFTFSAYIGAVRDLPPTGVAGGIAALLAIFLPALLLVMGTLPFWNRIRSKTGARAALAGTNAAVVGLLVAALYHPVFTEGVRAPVDFTFVLGALALLATWGFPAWLVVLLAAGAGQLVFSCLALRIRMPYLPHSIDSWSRYSAPLPADLPSACPCRSAGVTQIRKFA